MTNSFWDQFLPTQQRPLVAVGDVVFLMGNHSGRYGIVISVECNARRSRPLRDSFEPKYRVCYIDSQTGHPMDCPDDRCRNQWKTCPICSVYVWNDEIVKFDEAALRLFREEGMLADDLGGPQCESK
jgi:hypothetical protein